MSVCNIDTVTRDLIFDINLNVANPCRRSIRYALGFRDFTPNGSTNPKYFLPDIRELSEAIHTLAIERLPIRSGAKLRQAWKKGELLHTEIKGLLKKHGEKIWGIPMDQRRLVSNRNAPLLVKGEGDGCYPTDLFYGVEAHRAYIELQLEHLAYAKAFSRWRCKFKLKGKRATARSNIAPSGSKKVSIKACPSLIVAFSLPHEYLLMLSLDPKKRKHHVEDDYTHGPTRRVKDFDPSTPQGLRWNSPIVIDDSEEEDNKAEECDVEDHICYAPYTHSWTRRRENGGGSDGQDDEHAHQASSKRSKTEESDRKGKGRAKEIRYTSNTTLAAQHPYDEIRNNINARKEITVSHPTEDILGDQGANIVETNQDQPSNEILDPEVDRDHQNAAIVRENPLTLGLNQDDLVAPVGDELIDSPETNQHTTESKINLDNVRRDLHVILLGELRDTAGIYSTPQDSDKMWTMSQEINLHLKLLWTADRDKNLLAMGRERYKMVDKVLNEWLVRRDITRRLGSAAGVHTSQGLLPRLTGKEWAEKLGGVREFRDMDLLLATYRQQLLSRSGSGITKTDFADCLADAFVSMMQYSLGIEDFKTFYLDDILTFNRKLFAWTLSFAPN